jgi:integrase
MSKRGENIRKRKDGRWEARIKIDINGANKYHSIYGHSYKEVKEKKELYLKNFPLSPPAQDNSANKMTVEHLLNLWILDKELQLKKSTILKYKTIIATHIIPELGNVKLNNIDNDIINKFLLEKMKKGRKNGNKGLSNSYIKTMSIILSSSINYAVELGVCAPLRGKISKPSVQKSKIMVLSKEVQCNLENRLSSTNSTTELGIIIALNTGLRIGELCALRWSDIDMTNNIIHISHSVIRVSTDANISDKKTMLIIDTPKSEHSVRDIPITTKLQDYLKATTPINNGNYILSNSHIFLSPRTFEYRFHKVLNEHNIDDFNFHMLRHTFATRCIECNVDIKTLSEIMGHSNVNITLNNYVHPSFEDKRSQLEKLSQI